ncbi:MAG: hypothetical protein P0Y64_16570 [Candidatus Sphingomonas colombiensis]|nr:hypothetical protein [Sphingomonas sp.]WEK42933.1 MAG: hypothetical protein P0Y64_16570 [Sphingomonas sp.]
MTEDQFRQIVADMVAETCGSAAALARKHGVHPKALTLFLSGARGASAEVAAAFGYERRYVSLAALPPSKPDAVTDAAAPERVEAAHMAAFRAIYGDRGDPSKNPVAFDFCSKVGDAVLAATAGPAATAGEALDALKSEIERQCSIGAGMFKIDDGHGQSGLWEINADLDPAGLAASISTSDDRAEIERLRELVERAQFNVPAHYVNWHADARAALAQWETPHV